MGPVDAIPPPEPPPRAKFLQKLAYDDVTVQLEGKRFIKHAKVLWWLSSFATVGLLPLFSHWFPSIEIFLFTVDASIQSATHLLVGSSSQHEQPELIALETLHVSSPFYDRIFKPANDASEDSPFFGKPYAGSVALSQSPATVYYASWRCRTFFWHPNYRMFVEQHWLFSVSEYLPLERALGGLDSEGHLDHQSFYGENLLYIPVPSLFLLFGKEFLQPLNVFQLVSCVSWFFNEYVLYASVILLITLASLTLTTLETRKNLLRVKSMAELAMPISVYRSGDWISIESSSLVPGDVFQVPAAGAVLSCDAILLAGDAILDESILTGESLPINKQPPEDATEWQSIDTKHLENNKETRCILFAGTRLIRVRGGASSPWALAIVARTAFGTVKGNLVRAILFPKAGDFAFQRDSMRLLMVLAAIAVAGFFVVAAVVVFFPPAVTWEPLNLWKFAFDLVTVVVPPALPAAMAVGTKFALGRLQKEKIFCTAPAKINVAGSISLVCFDKTGTLTEQGLDILGVLRSRVSSSGSHAVASFTGDSLLESVTQLPATCKMLVALASCHSIKSINGTLTGDPLDLKMFEWTRWLMEESDASTTSLVSSIVRPNWAREFDVDRFLSEQLDDSGSEECIADESQTVHSRLILTQGEEEDPFEFGIIRCFEFVPVLRRMSVVIRRLNTENAMVITKGSPESVVSLCMAETVPADFESRLERYTTTGYRVIALACKILPSTTTWLKIQKTSRSDIESGLQFLGFIVFENRIKPTTKRIIESLRRATVRTLMCTGDNLLTAVSVSRDCGMLATKSPVFVGKLQHGIGDGAEVAAGVEWCTSDGNRLNPQSLRPLRPVSGGGFDVAITGDVFDYLQLQPERDIFWRALLRCNVFARMSPTQKQSLVEELQGMGTMVAFCGDGANDCGALRTANVGISLSEAEASVAAPFTSQVADISCVLRLLQEGRCALVTSFGCFKFMMLYSLVQFTTSVLLATHGFYPADGQLLYVDLFLICISTFAMNSVPAAVKLTSRLPLQKLISLPFLLTIAGHFVIVAVAQISVFYYSVTQSPGEYRTSDDFSESTFLQTRLFLLTAWQYAIVAFASCSGEPFRVAIYRSIWVVVASMVEVMANSAILIVSVLGDFDLLNCKKQSATDSITLGFWIALSAACCLAWDQFLSPLISESIRRCRKKSHAKTLSCYDQFQLELSKDMGDP